MIQHYREVRARLMRPPMPVVDRGIDLRRPRGLVPSRDPLPLPWWTPTVVDVTPGEPEWMAKVAELNEAWQAICGIPSDEREPAPLTINDIKRTVCRHYNISRHDIESHRRDRGAIVPRFVVIYLARTMTTKTLVEICRALGNRDHTCACNAMRKMTVWLRDKPDLFLQVCKIRASLHQRKAI